MPMRVVITDLLTGDCELTGRSNVEVARVGAEEVALGAPADKHVVVFQAKWHSG